MLIRGCGREESGLLFIKARDVVAANLPNESVIRGEIYHARPISAPLSTRHVSSKPFSWRSPKAPTSVTPRKTWRCALYRKYLKIDDPTMLDSMHKHYLLGSIPARPYPNIEDLSASYPHLRGRRAAEFLDISLLKSMETRGSSRSCMGNSRGRGRRF